MLADPLVLSSLLGLELIGLIETDYLALEKLS